MDAGMITIITTIIVEAAGIIGILIKSSADRNKAAREQAKRDQNIEDRLKVLEKKIDEHNGYAKRFGEIEKAVVRIDTRMESLHKL